MNLVKQIQVAGTKETREVKIHPCEFTDIALWQRKIHLPYVAPGGGLDAKWNWPNIFIGAQLSERTMGRKALSFQFQVEGPTGDAVPVAQALYSIAYHYPGDVRRKCVFIWYISAAPTAALLAHGVTERYALMGPLLDTAVQLSLDNALGGRIGLHAASGTSLKENAALVQRYLTQGLTQRVKTTEYFRRLTRKDDGKFFYFTEQQAAQFSSGYDYLR